MDFHKTGELYPVAATTPNWVSDTTDARVYNDASLGSLHFKKLS